MITFANISDYRAMYAFMEDNVLLPSSHPNAQNEKPDVLHIIGDYGYRPSVQKMVDNIAMNANGVTHAVATVCNLSDRALGKLPDVIDHVKPKIIHCHVAARKCNEAIAMAIHKPIAKILTIHGAIVYDRVVDYDFIFSVHEETLSLNQSIPIVHIENTVDVSWAARHTETNGKCYAAMRFAKLSGAVLLDYAFLSVPIALYGAPWWPTQYTSNTSGVRMSNVDIMDWENELELLAARYNALIHLPDCGNRNYDAVVFEAVALGVPVFARRQIERGSNQYVKHGYNGYLIDDFDAQKTEMRTVLQNPSIMANMKQNALVHADEIVNDMPYKYQKVYLDLLK